MERRQSVEKYVFQVIGYVFISLLAMMCLIPFLMIVIGSVTEESSIIRNGYSLIPSVFSLDAYAFILKNPKQIISAYQITLLVTIAGTGIGLFLTAMTAYVLQRKDFKYRNVFSFYFFFTTLFSGGLVPWYILIVKYLGWKDSLLALMIPPLLNVFYIIIMRSFISSTIPDAISESAKIDGAGDFRIFFSMILPLTKPALATIGLFISLNYWNDWYHATLFINKEHLYPLQYFLYKILSSIAFANSSVASQGSVVMDTPKESFKLAMTVIATGPIILLYPFVQKYFIQGITIGAVKG
ncbi:sugar ABC transporter permease [Paenibacillus marchantiophytorum]|uniref:Sugar ABC transporter permease n=1 Tax=Paenibacillus marchantiophytorum TaxID=1619310 RepID=A0ABQ1F7D1_9BACL|nr:carbohydrate ABC transporter permease [Paenibacillus marchantiophytorum]GGA02310.1 sugar ABC transporter permease [Paenibacillus marchantiophytorum]